MTQPKVDNKWEKEFDKKFVIRDGVDRIEELKNRHGDVQKIKAFISKLITQTQRENKQNL